MCVYPKGDGGLEFKYLKERRVLRGGVGPGTAEKFKKVSVITSDSRRGAKMVQLRKEKPHELPLFCCSAYYSARGQHGEFGDNLQKATDFSSYLLQESMTNNKVT